MNSIHDRWTQRFLLIFILLITFHMSLAQNSPACFGYGSDIQIEGISPGSAVKADFNNDGRNDLAVAISDGVMMMMGTGSGTFQPVKRKLSFRPNHLSLADFNADGRPDLVTEGYVTRWDDYCLINNGDATFTERKIPASVSSSLPGDVNHDGKTDVVAYNANNEQLVYLGVGDGTFTPTTTLIGEQRDLRFIVFNMDGHVEMMGMIMNDFSIRYGNGDGTFGAVTTLAGGISYIFELTDYNDDGLIDLVTKDNWTNELNIWLNVNNGFGSTIVKVALGTFQNSWARSGDFNADGRDDLVIAYGSSSSSSFRILRNNGNGYDFLNIHDGFPSYMVDYNDDGYVDFVTMTGRRYTLSGLKGAASAAYDTPFEIIVNTAIYKMVAANFYSDAKDDVVVVNGTDATLQMMGYVNGISAVYTTGANPVDLDAADFNKDGYNDVAVANKGSNNISLFLGTGTITLTPAGTVNTGVQPGALVAKDFNHDGNADVITANQSNLTYLRGNGGGGFAAPVYMHTLANPAKVMESRDINNDSHEDLVVASEGTGDNVVIFLGDGSGAFSKHLSYSFSSGVNGIAILDYNSDGQQDILVVAPYWNVLLGNGTGGFTLTTKSAGSTTPFILAADLTADGRMDLFANGASINDGAGNFSASRTFFDMFNPTDAVVGDFNGDGMKDIAVTSSAQATLTWYLNATPRIVANGPTEFCRPAMVNLSLTTGSVSSESIVWQPTSTTTRNIDATATATYQVLTTVAGCSSISNAIPVKVNGLTSPLNAGTLCNNATFNYQPTSIEPATTFTWTRAAIGGINEGAASSGSGSISEQLRNSSEGEIYVTYQFTLSPDVCGPQTVTVKVLPTLKLLTTDIGTKCSPTGEFQYIAISNVKQSRGPVPDPVNYSWSRTVYPELGQMYSKQGTTNWFIDQFSVTTPNISSVVKYNFTLSLEGCQNTQQVKVRINTQSSLSIATTTVCDGTRVSINPASTIRTPEMTWTWTRLNNANMNPPTSTGTGIVDEVLDNTNSSYSYPTVSYKFDFVTPACANSSSTVSYIVKSDIHLTSTLTPPAICNGATFKYTPTAAPSYGVTLTWVRLAVPGILDERIGPAACTVGYNGCGINDATIANPTSSPISVTYRCTLAWNGCSSVQDIVVVVNPTPTLTMSPPSPTICNGSSIGLTMSGASTYTWTPSTGLSAATGASVTASPTQTTTYNITGVSAAGCSVTTPFTVTVKAVPQASASPQSICSGETTNIVLSSSVAGSDFAWVVKSMTNATGASAASGAGPIAQVLQNSTTSTGTVTYSVTPTKDACSGPAIDVVATVKPIPAVTNAVSVTACSGKVAPFTPVSTIPNTTFSWTATTTGTVTGGQSSSGATISDNLKNTSTANGIVQYAITPELNQCVGPLATYTATVLPEPGVTISGATSLCTPGATTLTATSPTANSTFTWSPGTTTGNKLTIYSGGTYTATASAPNGCQSVSLPFTVTAKSAYVYITSTGTFCNPGYVTLTATAGSAYKWSTGATTQSIKVYSKDYYSVTVYFANGCIGTSAIDLRDSQPPPNAKGNSTMNIDPCGSTSGGSSTPSARIAESSAYPIPADEVLTIQLPTQTVKDVPVKLVTIHGKAVASGVIRAGTTSLNLNVSDVPKGFYIVYMSSGHSQKLLKVTIEHSN